MTTFNSRAVSNKGSLGRGFVERRTNPALDRNRTDLAVREDLLQIQTTSKETSSESSSTKSRVQELGSVARNAYLHLSLDAGQPTRLGGVEIDSFEIGTEITVKYSSELPDVYTAVATSQLDGANTVFWTDSRSSQSVVVRATTLAGAVVDLSVGQHEFVLVCRSVLPEGF